MHFLGIARFMKQFYSKQIWKKNWYVDNASLLSLTHPPSCLSLSPQILDISVPTLELAL